MKVGTLLDRIAAEYAAQTRDDESEFTADDYARMKSLPIRTARDHLKSAEADGVVVSRLAVDGGHRVRLYREAT